MKAIDENYELQDQKKAIDEFKSAFEKEHAEHVKCFAKAIDEFKAEDGDKAFDDLTTKAGDELARHEKAHMDLCKAEFGEGHNDGKSADEPAPEIQKPEEIVTPAPEIATPEQKSGRQISAKNKAKIEAVMKSIDEYKAQHAADHEKFSNNVIAALKDLMGPEGSEGEEQHGKAAAAPKPKVEVRATRTFTDTFEAFMNTRRVLRTVDTAVGSALKNLNDIFREEFPNRR